MVEKRWALKEAAEEEVIENLHNAINVSRPLANILAQRGIDSFEAAKSYFRPSLKMLHDPFLMKDMDLAVERIEKAIAKQEHILVYGDYDVDGTTSVALFFHFLNSFYPNCDFYIPDRYKEGYGVSRQGVDWAHENNFSLIITLDCGIKSVELVKIAAEKKIDFIICDHHRPGDELPPAVATLDPKRDDCPYPYKELPGCGIGFKLMQALTQRNPKWCKNPLDYLDLVVVSIASDIVPITGENRVLAHFGIKKLNEAPRPGLAALMHLSGVKKEINITGIVFGMAPRINAAGRIDHAKMAVNLLLASSEDEAYHYAEKLNIRNNKRKDFDSSITDEAIKMIENDDLLKSSKTTVLFKNDWHKGVIGIVASRCIEHYHRPTIILTESNNKAAGSARSVPGFDVYNAISSCSDLLEQFGGHKYAAGLTMDIENIPAFQQKFEEVVANSIPEELLIPLINIDSKISFNQISKKFLNIIAQMEPFGPENMQPVFLAENVSVASSLRVLKNQHLKFIAQQKGSNLKFDVIGFNLAEYEPLIRNGQNFSIAFNVEENNYMGYQSIQLKLKDIKFE
ncbi:single-stranded-DNA-specific exonuclease RecJ [Fulvivirga sediminis]|uniref:Single-stranded-DNA-specific exonuclease RecJ n=1 Tax=Fulvivirga sediminis TaxID=2803949 RepID=A0A937FC17_9BACT|nr:single-stranded-DNA-specific exonuclease RecJ [Fulvivirga sediminis]MBL3657793.1 single-stranded-DNA-specific exonuclease RecJ [Fulvivirga sediminis]